MNEYCSSVGYVVWKEGQARIFVRDGAGKKEKIVIIQGNQTVH